jgi:hypothetical protein
MRRVILAVSLMGATHASRSEPHHLSELSAPLLTRGKQEAHAADVFALEKEQLVRSCSFLFRVPVRIRR